MNEFDALLATIALAPAFLPKTGAVFGRASKRALHWLYKTDLWQTEDTAVTNCKDPLATTGKTVAELRTGGGGNAAQTVGPGSTHESGEAILWEPGCAVKLRAHVDGAELKRCWQKLNAASLLMRYWTEGVRNEATLALAGAQARLGWKLEEAEAFVEAVCKAAGDDEVENRAQERAPDLQEARGRQEDHRQDEASDALRRQARRDSVWAACAGRGRWRVPGR